MDSSSLPVEFDILDVSGSPQVLRLLLLHVQGLHGVSQNCGFFDMYVFRKLRGQFVARRSSSLGDELDLMVRWL